MSDPSLSNPDREIKVKWPKLNATVTVRTNTLNTNLLDVLWDTMPYRSLQTHALVTGDHLYHLVPSEPLIYTDPEFKSPDRANEPDGTVFLSKFQHMAIKYGTVTEHHPAAPVGHVIAEDMPTLRRVGNEIWKTQQVKRQPIEVIVWDASQPEPKLESLSLNLQRTGVTQEVRDLVSKIHKETDKTWTGISDDIHAIHTGRSPEKPGSKDSYFAAMVFSNSEVRAVGYYLSDNILKMAATCPDFDVKHLITLFRSILPVPIEFLGYVGTQFLCESQREISKLITSKVETNSNKEEAREDLLAMVNVLAQYANLLNAQNLYMFPWVHTAQYQYTKC